MKKMVKPLLLTLAALVLLAAAATLVYFRPMFSMKPAPTGPVGDTGVLALRTGNNAVYLLECEDGYIAIDAGGSARALEAGLEEMGINPGDVRYLLLTHTDSDHTAGLGLLSNAGVYMGADERQMANGAIRRSLLLGYNTLPDAVQASLTPLENRETLTLGGREIIPIATPGHTPGSVSYLVDGTLLFTGDAAGVKNGSFIVHPFTMDKEQALASIEILQSFDGVTILTAHYGVL